MISAEELDHVLNWASGQKAQHTRVFPTTDVPKKGGRTVSELESSQCIVQRMKLQRLQAPRRGSLSKDFLYGLLPAAPLILFLQVPKEPYLEARTSRLWLEFCHLNRSCSGNRMNSFSFWVVPNIQYFWGILAQFSFCFFKLFL